MQAHIKALGLLCILVGGLGGLASGLLLGPLANPAATAAYGPVIDTIVRGWLWLLLILAIPCIALGIGLLKFRPWARSIGTVIAILELLNFPIGTALGVYALWVIMSPEADALFSPRFHG